MTFLAESSCVIKLLYEKKAENIGYFKTGIKIA
jgi:hypothetical protein